MRLQRVLRVVRGAGQSIKILAGDDGLFSAVRASVRPARTSGRSGGGGYELSAIAMVVGGTTLQAVGIC